MRLSEFGQNSGRCKVIVEKLLVCKAGEIKPKQHVLHPATILQETMELCLGCEALTQAIEMLVLVASRSPEVAEGGKANLGHGSPSLPLSSSFTPQ